MLGIATRQNKRLRIDDEAGQRTSNGHARAGGGALETVACDACTRWIYLFRVLVFSYPLPFLVLHRDLI
jgi:hypothetical protein